MNSKFFVPSWVVGVFGVMSMLFQNLIYRVVVLAIVSRVTQHALVVFHVILVKIDFDLNVRVL